MFHSGSPSTPGPFGYNSPVRQGGGPNHQQAIPGYFVYKDNVSLRTFTTEGQARLLALVKVNEFFADSVPTQKQHPL